MKRFVLSLLSLVVFTNASFSDAVARDQIRAVGSSTLYPFITVVAEEFGLNSDFKTPVIEATGTGGGMKLFCSGIGEGYPDLSNASRAIKDSERENCAKNGINEITEIKLGYDGIVLANFRGSKTYHITKQDLFNALAKQVIVDGKLVENPYKNWNEIDPKLPESKIEVYGPPPTSGTRDAFVELVLEKVCKNDPVFVAAYPDEKIRKKTCHFVREDGHYIDSGENDNLVIQKLKNNPRALGLFGFSFLDQNAASVQGAMIDGIEPTFETISSGDYPISRPLYVYAKNDHFGKIKGLSEFVRELVSEKAVGEEGYLTYRGLIPLPDADRIAIANNIEEAIQ